MAGEATTQLLARVVRELLLVVVVEVEEPLLTEPTLGQEPTVDPVSVSL